MEVDDGDHRAAQVLGRGRVRRRQSVQQEVQPRREPVRQTIGRSSRDGALEGRDVSGLEGTRVERNPRSSFSVRPRTRAHAERLTLGGALPDTKVKVRDGAAALTASAAASV